MLAVDGNPMLRYLNINITYEIELKIVCGTDSPYMPHAYV